MRYRPSPKQINGISDDIAAANITVGKTVDSIMSAVSSKSAASKRSDWYQIQKTFRTAVVNSLIFGDSSLETTYRTNSGKTDLSSSGSRNTDYESSNNE